MVAIQLLPRMVEALDAVSRPLGSREGRKQAREIMAILRAVNLGVIPTAQVMQMQGQERDGLMPEALDPLGVPDG